MAPISAVIITFNEEANIRRCLESVQEVADQVLVVDSYSTDQTPDICRDMGVDFIRNPFEGHIEQKNFAMEQARFNYVLSLDADEALSKQLKSSILGVKDNLAYEGYYFNRLTNYCGQWIWHCGWYPDRKLRLWNRQQGRWGGVNPHDKIQMEKGAITSFLKGNLLHYSFLSIFSHAATANKFSDIVARELYKKGKRPNILIHLLLNPAFTFFKKYCLIGGWLDGYYGFVVCVISCYYNFLKYAKTRALYREQKAS